MKILITGASGFIGKNLLLHMKNKDGEHEITAVYCNDGSFPGFLKVNKINAIPVYMDLRDSAGWFSLNERFDLCVFLCANSDPTLSAQTPVYDLESNVMTLINVCSWLKVDKLIFMSSGAVYDGLFIRVTPHTFLDPKLPYAISKLAAEQYVKYFQKTGRINKYIILRFDGAYGPYESARKITSRLIKELYIDKKKEFVIRGDGTNYINVMYIEDVVRGLLKVMFGNWEYGKEIYNFCAGNPSPVTKFVRDVCSAIGCDDVNLIHKGCVAEPIKFIVDGSQFNRDYNFKVEYDLETGMKEFLKWADSQL